MTTTKLKVRLYGDPCLRRETEPVREVGPGERMLINAMITTMNHAKGIGLAAPQVGINSRIFIVDIGDGPQVFINPKIVKSVGSADLEEGCLSIPGVNIVVSRPTQIVLQYVDENNQQQEAVYDELMARVIQHENDHLHGKLIVDYASDDEKKKFEGQLQELESQNRSQ